VIGAGPAGLVLGHLLHRAGIPTVVLERQTAECLRARMKAGMVEDRTVELLRPHGLAAPILERGARNGVCEFRVDGRAFVLDYAALTGGRGHYIYPQQELVGDWADALVAAGGEVRFGARVTAVRQDGDGARVVVADPTGVDRELPCEFVACCSGATRDIAIDADDRLVHAEALPFRWLTVIAAVPPSSARTIYGLHRDGFAGQMRRSPEFTRYMLEIPVADGVCDWPDDRVWPELRARLEIDGHPPIEPGRIVERDALDLRVEVREPMQSGRVFFAGDAAHLITPAGGKGMNMAIQDAVELAAGIVEHRAGSSQRLSRYSAARLPEVWRYQEFSYLMLGLLHSGIGSGSDNRSFSYALRRARIERLFDDPAFARWFAHAYAGVDQEP
jgi:p-hydroxybenzoate 3-monooxygenase